MMTKFMAWSFGMLRKIGEMAFASINRFSRPRKEIATASVMGHCPAKTAYEAKHGSPDPDFNQAVKFRVGHAFELDLALRLIAGGFKPVEPSEIFSTPGPCFCGGGDLLDVTGITADKRKELRAQGVLLPTEQLTLEVPDADLGGNFDIVVKHKNGEFVIIEDKTTESEITEPMGYWVEQLKTLIGIFKTNAPAGTIVRGSVYARINNSEEVEYEVQPPTEEEWARLMHRARHIAAAKRGEVEPAREPSHLCGLCHARTCPFSPAGRAANALPLPVDVARAAENYRIAKDLEASYKAEADRCKEILETYAGDKRMAALAGDKLVLVSPVAGKVSINSKLLATLVPPEVLEACSKKGKGYMKIEVREYSEPEAAS